MKLHPDQNGLHSLKDLCQVLTAGSGRAVIVDKRCEDQLLLFLSPHEQVDALLLMRFMSESTGLQWRPVGRDAFLTYTLESGVIVEREKIARQAEDSNAGLLRAVLEQLLANVPVTASEFLAPPQRWGGLPVARQNVFRELALNAPQMTNRAAVKRLLDDKGQLESATVEFVVIPKVVITYGRRVDAMQAFQPIKIGLGVTGCE